MNSEKRNLQDLKQHQETSESFFIKRFWFLTQGPFSEKAINDLLMRKSIGRNSRIWSTSKKEWEDISTYSTFRETIERTPPGAIDSIQPNLPESIWIRFALVTSIFLCLLAFLPFDFSVTTSEQWWPFGKYSGKIYLIKNPKTEGFWPFASFETHVNAKQRWVDPRYTWNGILAGWSFMEFMVYVGGFWAGHYTLKYIRKVSESNSSSHKKIKLWIYRGLATLVSGVLVVVYAACLEHYYGSYRHWGGAIPAILFFSFLAWLHRTISAFGRGQE